MQVAAASYDSHNCLVGEVSAVCQDEAAQILELVDAPAVEAGVGDGGAACEVQAFKAVGGVVRNVRHAAVLDVLTIAKSKTFELWCADDAPGSWRRFAV